MYGKIYRCSAIFLCFVFLFLSVSATAAKSVVEMIKEDSYKAGFFYGFYAINTDGLEHFCKDAHIPRKYIKDFKKKYEKEYKYSVSFIKFFNKGLPNYKAFFNQTFEIDFNEEKKEKGSSFSKRDYCLYYDENREDIIAVLDERLRGKSWKWPNTLIENEVDIYKDNKETFSSKGKYNALGHNIEIQYPKDWVAKNPIRKHVVGKFVEDSKDDNRTERSLILMIVPIGQKLSHKEAEDFFKDLDKEKIKPYLPPKAEFIDGAATNYDGEPGFWVSFKYREKQSGIPIVAYILAHIVVYDDIMIMENIGVFSAEVFEWFAKEKFDASKPLFMAMGNDIVIHDKYNLPFENNKIVVLKSASSQRGGVSNSGGNNVLLIPSLTESASKTAKSPSSRETFISEEFIFRIIISLLFTWGFALGVASLIRFLLVGKALSKISSFLCVAAVFLLQLIVSVASGNNGYHTALVLVAFVSFHILRSGAEK